MFAMTTEDRSPYPAMKHTDTIIIKASIFIGNMTPAQRTSLTSLPRGDIESLTGFALARPPHAFREQDGELIHFNIAVDRAAPNYQGEAFVKEDFIEALLDCLGLHP